MNNSELNHINLSPWFDPEYKLHRKWLNYKRDDFAPPTTCNFTDRQAFQTLKLHNKGLSRLKAKCFYFVYIREQKQNAVAAPKNNNREIHYHAKRSCLRWCPTRTRGPKEDFSFTISCFIQAIAITTITALKSKIKAVQSHRRSAMHNCFQNGG